MHIQLVAQYHFLQNSGNPTLPELQPWFQGVQQVGLVLDFGKSSRFGLANPQLSNFYAMDKYTCSAISDVTTAGRVTLRGVFVQVTEQFLDAVNQKKETINLFMPLEVQTLLLWNSVEGLDKSYLKGDRNPLHESFSG